MNEENKNNETDVDDSIGWNIGTIIGHIVAACITSVIIAVTIRLVSWILAI